jgi:hypothetical protein
MAFVTSEFVAKSVEYVQLKRHDVIDRSASHVSLPSFLCAPVCNCFSGSHVQISVLIPCANLQRKQKAGQHTSLLNVCSIIHDQRLGLSLRMTTEGR